jgi:predicted dehydrogenase
VADLHAAAVRMVPEAEIVAVASPTPGKAAHFARERGIPHAFEDYGELLPLKDVQLVTLALPNQRAKQMADEGALGRVFLVKQSEEHFGPHSPWFWDVNRSGGGVLLDMGCHSIEFARWVFGKPRITKRRLATPGPD